MIIIRIYGKNNNAVLFLPKEQRQSFYSKQDRFVREAKNVSMIDGSLYHQIGNPTNTVSYADMSSAFAMICLLS